MERGKLYILRALFILMLAASCEKSEYYEVRHYPRIGLNENIIQDESGISFEASILTRAGEIEDKGFVWDEGTGANLLNGSMISLGPGYGSQSFTAKIDYGIEKDLSYEVRAYLVSEGRVIYSKTANFVSWIDGRK